MINNIMIIVVVVIVLSISAYFEIFNFYQKKYYENAYKPQIIKFRKISKYPEQFMINGITNVSNDKQYQESSALKMISDVVYPEEKLSIEHINFLMGYTYGTSFNLVNKNFIPFSEPIEGLRISAPFIGLKMDYYTTYSVKLFVDAVKYYISKGYPVLVQLDMCSFLNKAGFYPHSELFVGYDKKGFFYYETIGKQNEEKKYIKMEKLITATNRLNKKFKKPWKYGFCVFTVVEKNKHINDLIKRNGNSLIGEKKNKTATGAQAIGEFAEYIKETKTFNNEWILETLKYSRSDNAKFLEQFFENNSNLKKASELFKEASENYNKSLKIMKKGRNEENINEVSRLLFENSQLEEQIGKLLGKAANDYI
ncbi:cysteine peptidase family C39 domain-containing protein [Clostridium felsineum]|uniref:Uncharacterized protein n=1 Tax=Clostridium felsineum TaxID=36839 RepID=A0A1S8MCD1_9CLOT|nr:hypothetical protein [Clostridium felsineum]URZ04982.1 hypothetical protein CLROS_003060 [Clostridium felsineum]URZ10023.1 hypothetical protein CROST_007310 [Clostridium felsineum]